MRLTHLTAAAAIALTAAACAPMDGDMNTMDDAELSYVSGAAMYPDRTIVANASNSPIHTTLVNAVQQADLVDTLNSPGPFTVFAPTNQAFDQVPQSMLNDLMRDGNEPTLRRVLSYHVVPGRITADDLMNRIRAGNGTLTLPTLAGDRLTFRMMGDQVMLTGFNGTTANVTQANVFQSNGVIHVLDGVLLPNM